MAALVSDFVSDSMWNHTHTRSGSPPPQRSSESSYPSLSKTEPPPRPRIPPSPGPPQPISATEPAPPPASRIPPSVKYAEEDLRRKAATDAGRSMSPTGPAQNTSSHLHQQFSSQQSFPQISALHGQEWSNDPKLTASAPLSSQPAKPLARPARSMDNIAKYGPNTIKVRDLAHIRSFANEEFLSSRGQAGRRKTPDDATLKYEISGMPITDIIEMVAGLLTKITTTNDRQHENLHRPLPYSGDSPHLSGMSSSVLAFHGKNVPSITILSYLSRIHKYCPTTYEVFLSLLVYFDRMTERVNTAPVQAPRRDSEMTDPDSRPSTSYSASGSDLADSPVEPRSEHDSLSDAEKDQYTHAPKGEQEPAQYPLSHFFVVDSFNIHRLVISGVTCASKFFSDVFYTNSRYAKVCFSSHFFHLVMTCAYYQIRLEVSLSLNLITWSCNSSSSMTSDYPCPWKS